MEEDDLMQEWENFEGELWKNKIDVEDFIIKNYKEYKGTSEFLTGASRRTNKLWSRCQKLFDKESFSSILDVENSIFSGIDNFDVGYIDRKNEVIYGLQTDEPLKQFVNPFVALKSSIKEIKNYGYRFNKEYIDKFYELNKSYEKAVDDTYTYEIKKYKELKLIGGLADTHGRGFIVGDYRRIPLYGIDYLINSKLRDLNRLRSDMSYSIIRTREEVVNQIDALRSIKNMASHYGFDIGKPASNAKEAIQWLYFGYLAAVKENNGVSIPVGNNSTFLDIYIERDINKGILTEELAQELIDQFIIKLRLVRFLFNDEYSKCYFGKRCFITETIGGVVDNKSLITKTAFRFINTINNIGEYSIPNFAILWSKYLPLNFKKYCSRIMMRSNVLEYINGDLFDSSNCASTGTAGLSKIGKQIDYYGVNCNLPKILLYAINGGKDEITGEKIIDGIETINDNILDYSVVVKNFAIALRKVLSVEADAVNILHYNHDKYAYESSIMALNDTVVERFVTFDISGFSNVVDSLSAIRFSKVKAVRNEKGIATDFNVDTKFPCFGTDKEEVDKLATDIIKLFNKIVSERSYYRNAKPKVGINTYGMNIIFGKKTGTTPDGRFIGIPYSTGVNPVSNVDSNGFIASLNSILKIPSNLCTNGIITTLNLNHGVLGSKNSDSSEKAIKIIDSFFEEKGRHLEINIIDKNDLLNASSNPKEYENIVLRNSGCLILYRNLSQEQRENLIDRTFHKSL